MQNITDVKDLDSESEALFHVLGEQEKLRSASVAQVRTVLVVLSSRGMVFDTESLREKILLSYPQAAVFFLNTLGKPKGPAAPRQIDLLIDFTGPGQRQSLFLAKKLRRMARVTVGRNAGFFRKKIYDRVFDEKAQAATLPKERLQLERVVQRALLEMAGIPVVQAGPTLADLGKSIALSLPPMQKL
jgi:hypothetical protein